MTLAYCQDCNLQYSTEEYKRCPNCDTSEFWPEEPKETDPNGLDPHASGAKLDAGKVKAALVMGAFSRALLEVCKVGTFGANKYSDNGWLQVPDGQARYDDAQMRHWLESHIGEDVDPDSDLDHLAHEAWNALARLELKLREQNNGLDNSS